MNLHPILVHFPVALLTVYAMLELASLIRRVRERPYVFYLKAFLVTFGALAAAAAFVTGWIQKAAQDPASEFYRAMIVHEDFAIATLVIFGLLAVAYAAAWACRDWTAMPEKWKNFLVYHRFITEPPVATLLALLGLAAVTVTGAMGGSLVYGPDVDPFVKILYGLLVK